MFQCVSGQMRPGVACGVLLPCSCGFDLFGNNRAVDWRDERLHDENNAKQTAGNGGVMKRILLLLASALALLTASGGAFADRERHDARHRHYDSRHYDSHWREPFVPYWVAQPRVFVQAPWPVAPFGYAPSVYPTFRTAVVGQVFSLPPPGARLVHTIDGPLYLSAGVYYRHGPWGFEVVPPPPM